MAATFVELGQYSEGGLTFRKVKATCDAATAVYTLPGGKILLGMTFPFKSTGSASALTPTYAESTGVLTISGLTNTDVIHFMLLHS